MKQKLTAVVALAIAAMMMPVTPTSASTVPPIIRTQLVQAAPSLGDASLSYRQSVHLGTISRAEAVRLMQSDVDRHRQHFGLASATWIVNASTQCQANGDAATGKLQHFRPGCSTALGEILAAGTNRAPASSWLRSAPHREIVLATATAGSAKPVEMSAAIACADSGMSFEALRVHTPIRETTGIRSTVPVSNFSVLCNGSRYELYVALSAVEVGFRTRGHIRTASGMAAVAGPEALPASVDANGRVVLPRLPGDPVVRVGHTGAVSDQTPSNPVTTPETDCSAPQKGSFASRVDADPAAAQVFRLYSAFFLRPPGRKGLDYWVGVRQRGGRLQELAWSFGAGAEFANRYGALSNRDYVKLVFNNVLCRQPGASGLDYWTIRLDSGRLKRHDMIIFFAEGDEFLKRTKTRYSAA